MKPGFLKEPLAGNLGLLALRCVAGLSFALHGYDKIFGENGVAGFAGYIESLGIPMPLVAAWLAALSGQDGVSHLACNGSACHRLDGSGKIRRRLRKFQELITTHGIVLCKLRLQ